MFTNVKIATIVDAKFVRILYLLQHGQDIISNILVRAIQETYRGHNDPTFYLRNSLFRAQSWENLLCL